MLKKLLAFSQVLTIGILLFLFVDGANKMFFHQDDIILLWDLVTNFPKSLLGTSSGHLIVFFRPFYLLEWHFFRLHFSYYLAVSVLLHTLVIYTAGKVVHTLTKQRYWQILTVLVLVVNANFYEIIWMSSSQMMSLSVLFSLLSLRITLKLFQAINPNFRDFFLLYVVTLLPGLNWGTGLVIPLCLLLAYGWKKDKSGYKFSSPALPLLVSQLTLIIIYYLSTKGLISNTTKFELSPHSVTEIIKFVFFGISYSIVGRFLFPLASRFFRFVVVGVFLVWLSSSNRLNLAKKAIAGSLRTSILTAAITLESYFLIALGRWQYGLGQAGAPRYAYLPMVFIAIGVSVALSKINFNIFQKKVLLLSIIFFTLLSLGGFTQVTAKWTERPQKNKAFFQYIQHMKPSECLVNDFIPWYMVEVDTWTLKDIWPIFEKGFNPFTEKENCTKINRDKPTPWSVVVP